MKFFFKNQTDSNERAKTKISHSELHAEVDLFILALPSELEDDYALINYSSDSDLKDFLLPSLSKKKSIIITDGNIPLILVEESLLRRKVTFIDDHSIFISSSARNLISRHGKLSFNISDLKAQIKFN